MPMRRRRRRWADRSDSLTLIAALVGAGVGGSLSEEEKEENSRERKERLKTN
ncbi:MAG: hypothetical protein ACLT76_02020 [Clostridium fessum]